MELKKLIKEDIEKIKSNGKPIDKELHEKYIKETSENYFKYLIEEKKRILHVNEMSGNLLV